MTHHTMSERSYHKATPCSQIKEGWKTMTVTAKQGGIKKNFSRNVSSTIGMS